MEVASIFLALAALGCGGCIVSLVYLSWPWLFERSTPAQKVFREMLADLGSNIREWERCSRGIRHKETGLRITDIYAFEIEPGGKFSRDSRTGRVCLEILDRFKRAEKQRADLETLADMNSRYRQMIDARNVTHN